MSMKNHDFDAQIQGIADTILADYELGRNIDRMDTFNQPDRQKIQTIVNQLLRIVYPGHFRKGTPHVHSTTRNLSALIEEAAFGLKDEISIALLADAPDGCRCQSECEKEAQRLTVEFFACVPKIRAFTETDLLAAYDGDPAAHSLDEIIIAYPGLQAITINRIAHELYCLKVPLIPRIMTEYAHSITGVDIHPGATIGRSFFIDHATGIVVGETTTIGNNVKIYQGVTLGALSTRGGQSLRGSKRHPTIEDNVTIYAGASILGGETVIGEGAVIGSNVFITHSIAPGTRVSVKSQELLFKGGRTVAPAGEEPKTESWMKL